MRCKGRSALVSALTVQDPTSVSCGRQGWIAEMYLSVDMFELLLDKLRLKIALRNEIGDAGGEITSSGTV